MKPKTETMMTTHIMNTDNETKMAVAVLEPAAESQLTTTTAQQPAPVGLFGAEPSQVIAKVSNIADALKAVISKQGLVKRIKQKDYVMCEGWTLLGTIIGVYPVLEWTREIEHGWEARVVARARDGAVIGAAEAQCTRKEEAWARRDDYALRSMAQTRATSKCLRMPLGFVMSMAGYEPTPFEEMPTVEQQPARTAVLKPLIEKPAAAAEPPPPAPPPFPTEESRAKMIAGLNAGTGGPNREIVTNFFRSLENPAALMEVEELEELPLSFVPRTVGEMKALANAIAAFEGGGKAELPYKAHQEPAPEKPKAKAAKVEKKPSYDALNCSVLTGVIEHTHKKTGTNSRGEWVRVSAKIGDIWASTFHRQLGETIMELSGKRVKAIVEKDNVGYTIHEIEEEGENNEHLC